MVKFILDGRAVEAEPGKNLLETCLSLGLDLPYFCWHPALGSVGACRQCAVVQYRDEHDTRGRLVMSCMTPIAEGLRVDVEAPQAREFRAGIIEFLMTNHPHDCPVCEEGGECHLQDMTVMTGHTVRRYRGLKRTHRNQYLGPFINHEMNRCIACYRCVRYYRDYAGGDDLDVFGVHNTVYFGRYQDGVLENEFSGNLVEVCPTGVFTDKTFSAHYVRKWDLSYAPSVCAHCAVGCNISPGERLGMLRRIINRYHGEVNGYFLCDRGRFGYGFVNSPRRIRQATFRGEPISCEAAVAQLAGMATGRAIGIGSPRSSLEANFALRDLVGADNFYAGFSRTEAALLAEILRILRQWPVRIPSLLDMEQADAVLVLGEDPTNTAPRIALALRKSVRQRAAELAGNLKIPDWLDAAVRGVAQQEKSPLFIAAVAGTPLDDVAAAKFHGPPEDIARLGFAIAHVLVPDAPRVEELSEEGSRLAATIAETLAKARHPLIVSGTGCASLPVIQAAANIAWGLALRRGEPRVDLCYVVPECNSFGLAMMDGRSVADAFASLRGEGTVVVLENDLYRRADTAAVDEFLGRAKHLAVIDHTRHATARRAELLLPGGTFAETEGTLVSLEGRAQRFFSAMPTNGEVRDAWRWPVSALRRNWRQVDALTSACAAAFPVLAAITEAAPTADFRIEGGKVPRLPARASGRTAMNADRTLHEPKPPDDPDSALSYTMEGAVSVLPPPALRPVAWAPRWNSHQQATAKFQDEVGGHLRGGDPGVRLIEPAETPSPVWFDKIPALFRGGTGWRAVPLHHIFGGEEQSAGAGPIGERAPKPYAAMHPEDIAALDLADTVAVSLGKRSLTLPLRVEATLKRGTVGIPVGLPDLSLGEFPIGVCPNIPGEGS